MACLEIPYHPQDMKDKKNHVIEEQKTALNALHYESRQLEISKDYQIEEQCISINGNYQRQ